METGAGARVNLVGSGTSLKRIKVAIKRSRRGTKMVTMRVFLCERIQDKEKFRRGRRNLGRVILGIGGVGIVLVLEAIGVF